MAGITINTLTVDSNVSVSGNGGSELDINGGNSTISFAAPISNGSAGRAVQIQNRTGGTSTLSGAITDTSGTGTGILLSSNSGATINLTGGVNASTGASNAFSATGGGTVNVTGSSNTLATSTGTALNVSNTTIGASGLNFQSISSNGASSGIVLNNTGSSGGLTVTGTGSAATGGTIQNSTDSGILGSSTRAPNLSFMNFTNNGNAVNEGGVRLTNISGTGQLTSSTVTGGFEDNVYLSNTSGTLSGFPIQGPNCTISNNNSSSGNTGVTVLAAGTSSMTVTVDNCSFTGNRSDTIHTDAGDSATLTSTITNNTITGGSPNQGNIGIEVTAAGSANVTYDVSGNKVGTPDGTTADPLLNTGINIFDGTALTSTMVGKVTNNVVMNDTSVPSGTSNGFGIRVFNSNLANIRAKVTGNTVKGVNTDYGILVESSGTTSAPGSGHARVDVQVSNNNVDVQSGALDAIRLQARNFNTLCGVITANTTDAGGTGFTGIQVRQANSAVFNLDGWTDHTTFPTAQSYVANQNPAATVGPEFGTITGVPSGTCNIPT
jgi:hypothetical protein